MWSRPRTKGLATDKSTEEYRVLCARDPGIKCDAIGTACARKTETDPEVAGHPLGRGDVVIGAEADWGGPRQGRRRAAERLRDRAHPCGARARPVRSAPSSPSRSPPGPQRPPSPCGRRGAESWTRTRAWAITAAAPQHPQHRRAAAVHRLRPPVLRHSGQRGGLRRRGCRSPGLLQVLKLLPITLEPLPSDGS